ncbi:MAG TPA: O-antigen ligase family protein [Terriglobia bacterium]|nr:O-antigen ligase family protein [Terriglobia bacterium]
MALAGAGLPDDVVARWASVFFSASVLTFLISIAAAQSFLALAALLYFAYLLRANPKPAIGFPPVKLPLALFCFFTVLSIFWAENRAVGWFSVRKLVLFLILLLTVNLIVSARHLTFLLKAMFVEAAVAGIVGAVQFVRQYERVRVEHPHRIYLYMTVTRITGFQGHWMNFGGQQMLVFCAIAALVLLARKWKPDGGAPRVHKLWWAVLVIILVSILLNFTRGVWLGCFAGAVYVVARWRALWLWILPVLVALSIALGPAMLRRREESVLHPSRDASLAVRFEMWHAGWRMIQKHPLVGVGPDNIPEVYDLYLPPGKSPIVGYHGHLHNDYIQFAAERGLPCAAAWLWFMLTLGIAIVRRRGRLTGSRWVADAAFAGWLAFVAEGFFEFNFGTSPVLMVFLFIMAAPFAAEKIEGRGAGTKVRT